MLGSLGRFVVRHRWAVIALWLAVAGAATLLLPSIGSVVNNDNASFLPATSPSVEAQRLAAPLTGGGAASGVVVASSTTGPLTTADQRAVNRIDDAVAGVPAVIQVSDGQLSADGEARTLDITFASATGGGGPEAARAVNRIRAIAVRLSPPGLVTNLTGSLPVLVDQQAAGGRTAAHVELFSAVFILLLLLLAFRALLAPLIALVPAALALSIAGPVIAESTKIGVQISSLLELLLTALVLGAGTDYGLFLVFRYRENLQQGMDPHHAVVGAVERVGASVAFSATTVVAALLTLLMASFGLYRGVGPGLAIGIVVVLLVELTFLPAALAVVGRAAFWPARPRSGRVSAGRWGSVAARVCARPVPAVVLGVIVFGSLAGGLAGYAPSGFNPGGAIGGSDSADGLLVLQQHFGPQALGATDVVFRLRRPIWGDSSLLLDAREALRDSGQFSSIDDALDASGVELPPYLLTRLHRAWGPPQSLPPSGDGRIRNPMLYDAYRSTAAFITADGRTVLFRTSLTAGGPGSTAALQAIPDVRATVARVAAAIDASRSGVAGQAAGAADVAALSGRDILRIAPVVLLVLAVILGMVLRSLVAPLYLVLSVALSYLASLGLAVMVFVSIGHQLGVNFTLPFFMFVFIMALGEDYNILVMNRIREEASRLPLRRAVPVAMAMTGSTVTSAGLVLSGTFGVLAAGTSGQVQQIATGLALGVLLDTFVVRTLLVPSTVVLLGRWNWWPSAMAASARPRPQPPRPARDQPPPEQSSEHGHRGAMV